MQVKQKWSDRPTEFLGPSSEIGLLHTLYLAHGIRQMLEAKSKGIETPLFPAVDTKVICSKELARRGDRPHPAYANPGKTPEAMDLTRLANQDNSALLRLPTEILTMIWRAAFESTGAKRVHGIASRSACRHGLLSLTSTCSLLHNVLYPVFLNQDAFVVKVSSADAPIVARELTRWWQRTAAILSLSEPIRPLIFLTLQTGWLPFDTALRLAAQVQNICSSTPLFQPRVLVETNERLCYYCGPGVLMSLQAPPMEDSWEDQFKKGSWPTAFDAPPLCHDKMWRGWVAVPVTERSLMCLGREQEQEPPYSWNRRWNRYAKETEMLAMCRSFESS